MIILVQISEIALNVHNNIHFGSKVFYLYFDTALRIHGSQYKTFECKELRNA